VLYVSQFKGTAKYYVDMSLDLVFFSLIGLVTVSFLLLTYRVDRKLSAVKFSKPKNPPKVSVIIPAHNAEKFIEKTLKSAIASSYKNMEIIVVNDCSDDGTVNILNRFKNIKILTNKKRLGKASSLNKATTGSLGNLVLFLDADTIIEKDTIEKLVSSYIHYNKAEGKIGFIAPKYRLINRTKPIAKLAYLEQSIHQFLIKIQMNLGSILSIRGCCMLMNKEAFFEANGFSNHLLEDGDFAAKVVKAGYKIKYEPRASVDTDEPENLRDLFRTRKRYGKGGLFCVLSHTKHFLFSKQAALSFYPYVLVGLAFLIFSVLENNLIFPMTIFSFGTIIKASIILSKLGLLGMAATTGMFIGGAVITKGSVKKIEMVALFLPYILLYIPFTTIGYLNGAINGISDKIKQRKELKLKDW